MKLGDNKHQKKDVVVPWNGKLDILALNGRVTTHALPNINVAIGISMINGSSLIMRQQEIGLNYMECQNRNVAILDLVFT
jgi:hypothetical protein